MNVGDLRKSIWVCVTMFYSLHRVGRNSLSGGMGNGRNEDLMKMFVSGRTISSWLFEKDFWSPSSELKLTFVLILTHSVHRSNPQATSVRVKLSMP